MQSEQDKNEETKEIPKTYFQRPDGDYSKPGSFLNDRLKPSDLSPPPSADSQARSQLEGGRVTEQDEANVAKNVKTSNVHPAETAANTNRIIQLNNIAANALRGFKSNYIRTTKYTLISFLPLGLLY